MKAKEIQKNILLELYKNGEKQIQDNNYKEIAIAQKLQREGLIELSYEVDFFSVFKLTGEGYIFIEENYLSSQNKTDELDSLLQSYNLLTEQLNKLRKDKIIETDTLIKFKLEKQIEQKEEERSEIEKLIRSVETDKISKTQNLNQSKYEIHFHGNPQGITIGDDNKVKTNFNE